MTGSDPRAGRGSTDAGADSGSTAPGGARGRRVGMAPSGLPSEDRGPQRPPRPALVELATAMLIVSGFLSFFLSLQGVAGLLDREEIPLLLGAVIVLAGPATMALGIALRYGHAWLLGVNVVAVAAFLELTSWSAQGLLFGSIDLFVVVVLLAQRPWFVWKAADEDRRGPPPAR